MAKRRGKLKPPSKRAGEGMGERLLFDPSRMAFQGEPADAPPPPPPPQPCPSAPAAAQAAPARFTVSELSAMITGALRAGLPPTVRVVGELSNVTHRTHWYFNLKDEGAVVNCVMFASAGGRPRRPAFQPRDGMEVVVTGRVDHYAAGGRTQLYVDSIEAVGAGALEARFRALCEELRALGWFDAARKRTPPLFPRRVAVVTSRTGAAIHDVLETMRRRCPAVDVLLVDVRVQSDPPSFAAEEIARALDMLSRDRERLGVDAVILTRGGGSIEDLWAFNERSLAEAILRCAVPVIAAIGHESDVTIAELVADVRASTPTQAAMRATPDAAALLEQTDQLGARLRAATARRIAEAAQRLRAAERRPALARPDALLDPHRVRLREATRRLDSAVRAMLVRAETRIERQHARLLALRPEATIAARTARVEAMAGRLDRAVRVALEQRAARLTALERQLGAVGPMSVLRRGFTVTLRPDGRPARSRLDLAPGDTIETRFEDGPVRSRVEPDGAGPAPLGGPELFE